MVERTKVKRTYITGCGWCGATGFATNPEFDPNVTCSSQTIICPVCIGTKVITVIEEYDALYEIDCSKMNVLTPFLGRVVIEKEEDGKNKI